MAPKKRASPPKKAAAPASDVMQPMPSEGSSSDWVKAKANMRRIGNLFLEHLLTVTSNAELSAMWGTEWNELTEETVTTEDFWGLLATFLVSVYVIAQGATNAGAHLDEKSAVSTWRGLFNQMRQTFLASTNRDTRVRCTPALRADRLARSPRADLPNLIALRPHRCSLTAPRRSRASRPSGIVG